MIVYLVAYGRSHPLAFGIYSFILGDRIPVLLAFALSSQSHYSVQSSSESPGT
ncbi:hypothetical protein [Limnofasciculus baicalensis]|uniref:Uncharacterized protein n=1 Tax=Limnofasciculus baicalensis BBK-W-15 TaxID=2699891 RepID=A0AAE3GNR1_9CYAN|nr:hypothetical protein [Limnofasciculus baicalensis]MCP2727206.1 hypothetical protein [Limnofasciculus baicalensis BBK-W-15]